MLFWRWWYCVWLCCYGLSGSDVGCAATRSGRIRSGHMDHYLLEKSRVTHQVRLIAGARLAVLMRVGTRHLESGTTMCCTSYAAVLMQVLPPRIPTPCPVENIDDSHEFAVTGTNRSRYAMSSTDLAFGLCCFYAMHGTDTGVDGIDVAYAAMPGYGVRGTDSACAATSRGAQGRWCD
eukprot:1461430-Rhodomonas_salina.1